MARRLSDGPERTITVVVPIYNKLALLGPALTSIFDAAEHHGRVEVVLVDNGSTDGSYEHALSYGDRAVVLRAAGTVAAVRNAGARAGGAPYLSFLDSDMVVPRDFFVRLEAAFAGGVAPALGCECHLPDDPHWVERQWHLLTVPEDDGYRHYLNSGNFALTRELFDRVGGFPEECVTGEDTEICRRILAAGGTIYQSQRLATKHLGNPKTIGGFFRRMRWHGLSASDGRRIMWHQKSTVMTVANAALVAAALVLVLRGTRWSLWTAGALVLAVPTATYVLRLTRVRRAVNPLTALVLIEVYYAARLAALGGIVARLSRERLAGRLGRERAREA